MEVCDHDSAADQIERTGSNDSNSDSCRRSVSLRGDSEVSVLGCSGCGPLCEDRHTEACYGGPFCSGGRDRVRRVHPPRFPDATISGPAAHRYFGRRRNDESSDAARQGLLGRRTRGTHRRLDAAWTHIPVNRWSWAVVGLRNSVSRFISVANISHLADPEGRHTVSKTPARPRHCLRDQGAKLLRRVRSPDGLAPVQHIHSRQAPAAADPHPGPPPPFAAALSSATRRAHTRCRELAAPPHHTSTPAESPHGYPADCA